MATKKSAPKRVRAKAAGSSRSIDARLAALPGDAGSLVPSIPVDVEILEARRCYAAAKAARPRFASVRGFSLGDIDDVPALVTHLRSEEGAWQEKKSDRKSKGLTAARREAEKLRRDLMAPARYLLRRNAEAQRSLDAIAEGEGLADLIQDLQDLVAFAKKYAAELKGDPSVTKEALARAIELAEQLTGGSGDGAEALDALERRNRAYLALHQALEEIRAAARYLFRHDPQRLAPYLSQYAAQKKRRSRANRSQPPAPADDNE